MSFRTSLEKRILVSKMREAAAKIKSAPSMIDAKYLSEFKSNILYFKMATSLVNLKNLCTMVQVLKLKKCVDKPEMDESMCRFDSELKKAEEFEEMLKKSFNVLETIASNEEDFKELELYSKQMMANFINKVATIVERRDLVDEGILEWAKEHYALLPKGEYEGFSDEFLEQEIELEADTEGKGE
jgi:hypothetical protein